MCVRANAGAYHIDIPIQTEEFLSCNTKKDKAKFYHRTAGILVGGSPRGMMSFVEEIFRSESISQVSLSLDNTLLRYENKIKVITYDDACHLAKYVKNHEELFKSNINNLEIKVDRFHFKNHIDTWCNKHCNPYTCDSLANVNTEIMEQFFSWIARFSYMVEYMTRYRFRFFILDLVDKHNFIINGLNPFCHEM